MGVFAVLAQLPVGRVYFRDVGNACNGELERFDAGFRHLHLLLLLREFALGIPPVLLGLEECLLGFYPPGSWRGRGTLSWSRVGLPAVVLFRSASSPL